MYKTYKFRIYSTSEQKTMINKNFGCSRFVYNHYLELGKKNKVSNRFENIKDCTHKLKQEYPFLQEADSCLLQKILDHLDKNYQRFFKSGFGYPKFKSKYSRNAYTTTAIYGTYMKEQLA